MKARSLQSMLPAFSRDDQEIIKAAREFAEKAHADQRRKSGDYYITHPLAVAQYAAALGMDADTVAAALLHDVVEDTSCTLEDIRDNFGESVCLLVDGVTKLGEINYTPDDHSTEGRRAVSVENLRKLLLAMSKDLRVIIIKLLDRLHNLQTLQFLEGDDRVRIAEESLAIFAPLADRLGMGAIKAEIEDLSFQYSQPTAYSLTKRLAATGRQDSWHGLGSIKSAIEKQLLGDNVPIVAIDARQKHLYSIYRKLQKTDGDITKIYDLVALRIIVHSVQECYQVLGILHMYYKPLIHRIKDYIAVPKPNGYRSLHTTVIAPDGTILEIQVRTQEMHDEAEYGLAAHAVYNLHKDTKSYRQGKSTALVKPSWVEDLALLSSTKQNFSELVDDLKIDLFQDRIFVFSPHGDLYDLPDGATPVDFAFAVHSDVGLRTQGAKVNNRLVPLSKKLENRDIVEILTKKTAAPNRQWLNFIKTAQARNRIKAYFRLQSKASNIIHGRDILEQKLKLAGSVKIESISKDKLRELVQVYNQKDFDGLCAAIGEGSIAVSGVVKRISPQDHRAARSRILEQTTGRAVVIGAPELPCSLGNCCKPHYPDLIIGFITRGNGITVHQNGCKNIIGEEDRLLECGWETIQTKTVQYILRVIAQSRIGMMRDIMSVIAANQINIVESTSYENSVEGRYSKIMCTVAISNQQTLMRVLDQLRAIKEVVSVEIDEYEKKKNKH